MLNAHNSKHELSIEKYLMKSEEAFFDKVKKDKLSSAASVRSSQRDSVWGTPAPSTFDHSRPSSPSGQSFAGTGLNGEYTGVLPNGNDVVIMTGLQIALAREVFGWPLYTIIIALGQVRLHDIRQLSHSRFDIGHFRCWLRPVSRSPYSPVQTRKTTSSSTCLVVSSSRLPSSGTPYSA